MPRKRLGIQDRLRRKVRLLRRKPLRSTVNGPPSSDKINRERALSRRSLRSREKREREREEPVIGQMRRNAGEEHVGTQGWPRARQVAMPASRGSFCWFNVVFSSDQRVHRFSACSGSLQRAAISGPLFLSVQRIFWARSRAGASRDDCLFLLHVILAMFRPGSCS